MRAAHAQFRPAIENKQLPKRRNANTARLQLARVPRSKSTVVRRRPARAVVAAIRPNGMSVVGLLAVVGGLLTLLFVTALQWQRTTLQIHHQEVELRSALDRSHNERRQLLVEQGRVFSPREMELRSRQQGLVPMKLDERTAAYKAAAKAAAKVETKASKLKTPEAETSAR